MIILLSQRTQRRQYIDCPISPHQQQHRSHRHQRTLATLRQRTWVAHHLQKYVVDELLIFSAPVGSNGETCNLPPHFLTILSLGHRLLQTPIQDNKRLRRNSGAPILDSVLPNTINTLHLNSTMARQQHTLCSMVGATLSSWLMGQLLRPFNPNTDKSNLSLFQVRVVSFISMKLCRFFRQIPSSHKINNWLTCQPAFWSFLYSHASRRRQSRRYHSCSGS